jgi:hypothetical protein
MKITSVLIDSLRKLSTIYYDYFHMKLLLLVIKKHALDYSKLIEICNDTDNEDNDTNEIMITMSEGK